MKTGVKTMKVGTGFTGASRIHYACYYILIALEKGNDSEVMKRYPAIVESIIEFRRFFVKLIHYI